MSQRLRIIHIEAGHHLYGGALQVLYLISGLQQLGHENLLVCPQNSVIARDEMVKNIETLAIPMHGDLDWRLMWRLARLIKSKRPDIVHVHSRRGAEIWGGLATKMLHIPRVLTRRVDNPETKLLLRVKCGLFHHIITISQAIKEILIRTGINPAKISCVPDAVDTTLYQPKGDIAWFQREFKLQKQAKIIGVIAQFIPRKGHRYLLAIAAQVFAENPDTKFMFFGQGPLEQELRQECHNRGLTSRIIFAGFRSDLARIVPCLYAVAHPADREGLGVALLQSAASGVPIIASAVGGIPEIVKHQYNGLLIAPGDNAALAQGLSFLLKNPEVAWEYGDNGRQLALQQFSLNPMIQGNLCVYQKLLRT